MCSRCDAAWVSPEVDEENEMPLIQLETNDEDWVPRQEHPWVMATGKRSRRGIRKTRFMEAATEGDEGNCTCCGSGSGDHSGCTESIDYVATTVQPTTVAPSTLSGEWVEYDPRYQKLARTGKSGT